MRIPGAHISEKGDCTFTVWSPVKESMILHITQPFNREYDMVKDEDGYFSLTVENITGGTRYYYRPGGEADLPDPASHYQPEGVHGPSEVVDHSNFIWTDQSMKGIPFKDLVIYEIHTGTFTEEGTFEAMIPRLGDLQAVGINTLEIMPVSQFPGSRNWGYDGVFPYAVQNSYGGPEGLKKLVNACHKKGMIVLLDVVYNHLGPEGNYFGKFAPYFSGKYKVTWGDAINFDDAWSDGVRDYFSRNPVHWAENYHIDGVRVDAIHTIFDDSAIHLWEEVNKKIKEAGQRSGKHFYLIAESDYNDPKVIRPPEMGGFGFDAQWLDDFHHALYVLIHPEGKDRYADFGRMEQLAKAYKDGFVHSGEFVKFRKRLYGASSAGIPGDRFVAFNQNHDQTGNRVMGERLAGLVDFERLKLAAASLLLSPYIPMLFMGEEYGEDNPFLYFISHSDEELIKAVREGRKKEFQAFKWSVEPPDAADVSTFNKSKPDWSKRNTGKYAIMLKWNTELISLRKTSDALKNTEKSGLFVYVVNGSGLTLLRSSSDEKRYMACFFNFSENEICLNVPGYPEKWTKILDSQDKQWKDGDKDSHPAPDFLTGNSVLNAMPLSVAVYSNVIEQTKIIKYAN